MRIPFIPLFLLASALCISGCGPSVGTPGDANDPAVNGTDAEQMELMMQEGENIR